MTDGPTLLEALSTLAATTDLANLPERQAASVPQRVLDIVGISIRAAQLPSSQAAIGFAVDQGGTPRCTAIGIDLRLPAPSAAFVNGVLAHSLDYDDTHLPSILHPSASVVPAVLATAEAHHLSGVEIIPAVAVGLETAVRLGMAGFDPVSGQNLWFDRGLHATSICGAIGAAAASAKLLGLDQIGIGHAMAVAASMASGIIEANRTGGTVKRLHCGWAAQAGVTAAELASRGLTGPPTVFEGRFGLFTALLDDRVRPEAVLHGLVADDPAATDWSVADIFYKPYPANHYTHAGIDAAISLRESGLTPDDVESAHLGVPSAIVRTIGEPLDRKQAPSTGYEAQFSGPYAVAAALIGGTGLGLGLRDFDDALVTEATRRDLMTRITVGGDSRCDAIYPFQFPAVLTVRTKSGDTVTAEVLVNRGGPQRPLSDAELVQKFADNAEGLIDGHSTDSIVNAASKLADVVDLGELLGPLSRPIGASAAGTLS